VIIGLLLHHRYRIEVCIRHSTIAVSINSYLYYRKIAMVYLAINHTVLLYTSSRLWRQRKACASQKPDVIALWRNVYKYRMTALRPVDAISYPSCPDQNSLLWRYWKLTLELELEPELLRNSDIIHSEIFSSN